MTPKQELLAHLDSADHALAGCRPPTKTTQEKLIAWHVEQHRGHHLLHDHPHPAKSIWGVADYKVHITLQPPKNPSASRNGDHNWTLHVAHLSAGRGWLIELPGTSANFPEEAQTAANKELGWTPTWAPKGWGFEAT